MWLSTVTCASFMASSSADCVLGVVRLISSARMMLAKIGPGLKSKRCSIWIEHAGAHHVGGKQVRSELDALEGAVEGVRQRLREGRLAHSGNVFNEQMAVRQQAKGAPADHFILAAQYTRNRRLQLRKLVCWPWSSLVENPIASATNEVSIMGD